MDARTEERLSLYLAGVRAGSGLEAFHYVPSACEPVLETYLAEHDALDGELQRVAEMLQSGPEGPQSAEETL